MRKLLVITALLLFAGIAFGQNKADIEKERQAILIVIGEHMDAIDSLDVDRLLEGQTEDFIEMPSNMPRLVGKQAYGKNFSTWIGIFKSLKQKEMSFVPDEFVVTGDWAFQIGTYSYKFTFQDDSLNEDTGNYVWIFKKEHDGNWKWARVISNSTIPLE
jgi:ketosteroid isomerase-like protein